MTTPAANVPYTAGDLKLLEDTLYELRRHGYKATRIVLPGVLEMELVPVSDEPEGYVPPDGRKRNPQEIRSSNRRVVSQLIHDLDENE